MSNKEKAGKKFPVKLVAILSSVGAIALAAVIALPYVLGMFSGKSKAQYFKAPESTLPASEVLALQGYKYEELKNVQATVRSDLGNILERGVKRTIPQVLTDDYALVYNKKDNVLTAQYGLNAGEFNQYDLTKGNYRISNEEIEAAKISFKKYPRVLKIGDTPAHSIGGGDVGFDATAMAGSGFDANSYLNFYKYMLFSQCYNLTTEAATRSNATLDNADEQAKFKRWLKKHPAADATYGRVLGSDKQPLNETNNDNAVTKKITVDPIYRSLHATGLYLPAGEPITVKIEGLKPGEQIGLKMNEQDSCAWVAGASTSGFPANYNKTTYTSGNTDGYFRAGDMATALGNVAGVSTHNHWSKAYGRLPWIRSIVNYSQNGTYAYGSPLGGVIEIDMKNCYSRVTITISGAVETPHYILGTTTPEYFDQYLRQAPGVVAILDVENGQLIGPTMEMGTTQYMRQVKTEEIDKLARLWHSFLAVNESFTGGVYNRFNKVMFDWLVPAGAAVSMGNYSFAQPTGWFDGCMNYQGLLAAGNWGTLHEIGHNHASSYGTFWGFGDGREGEVHNNALTLLSYIMFCDVGTTIRSGGGAEHGEYANPYRTLSETLNHPANAAKLGTTDYGDGTYYHYFQMLGMYANLMHSFGAPKFYELLYTYKEVSSYNETIEQADGTKKTIGNQRSDFVYRCAKIYGMNLINFFNKFYKANITDDLFSEGRLAEIKALPEYNPVSSFYAGGVDGVKTAGDYKVAFGEDINFDLLKNTISTLDEGDTKGFEITKIEQPQHGKITDLGGGKCRYTFDPKYMGTTDEFSFTVKLKDGVEHKLTIYLRISYNGARVSVYKKLQAKNNWNDILAEIAARQPDEVIGSSIAGVPGYNTAGEDAKEVRISEFYWKAPKTGTIRLSSTCDDWVRLYFGNSFEELSTKEHVLERNTYTPGYHESNVEIPVEEGKYYAVKAINFNPAGGGGANVGVRYVTDEGSKQGAMTNVFHPNFDLGLKEVPKYTLEPEFIISKKDNAKLSTTGSDKSEWEIVKAPENVLGGRFEKRTQVDTQTGEVKEAPDFDRWQYLVDGQAGTTMHTTYGGGVAKITPEAPHVFVLDTKKQQSFNYFTVTTRNNANSYIEDCELFVSDSVDGPWKSVSSATRKNYSGTSIKMTFNQTEGRYLKLEVKGTSGGNFSVLAELDTGIESSTQVIVPSISEYVYTTRGWVNSSTMDDQPNGYIVSDKKNEKVFIRFEGESFAIYAASGKDYGQIRVKVDGVDKGVVDLNNATEEMRKLSFYIENLSNKEHTVEIITQNSQRVMLSVFGLPYNSALLEAANPFLQEFLVKALISFVVITLALLTLVICLVFCPGFRKFLLGNRLIEKLDNRPKKQKVKADPNIVAAEKSDKRHNKVLAKVEKAEAKKKKKSGEDYE